MNNLVYKEHCPFEDNAHLWNTGGDRSAKLFTEAEEQGAEGRDDSPGKEKSRSSLLVRYRRGGPLVKGSFSLGVDSMFGSGDL